MGALKEFLSFLKIGAIGFGGGSALIPVVERELVNKRNALTDSEFLKHVVAANITPGALPVKLGASCGWQLGGLTGAVLGAYGVILPGTVLTVALLSFLSRLGADVIKYINYASIAVTAFIIFLLISFVHKTVSGNRTKLLICLIVFAATCGKPLRLLLGLAFGLSERETGVPFLNISTVNLMIISFFLILLLDKLRTNFQRALAVALSAAYAFLCGKTGESLGLGTLANILLFAMVLICLFAFIKGRRRDGRTGGIKLSREAVKVSLVFLLIPFIFCAALAMILPEGKDIAGFAANVAVSTLSSFGGGEAYVSIADGIFAQTGYVSVEVFYSQIVPVTNALPGPILIKIASGIGYVYGEALYGSAAGTALAALAAVTAVGVCGAVAVQVVSLYDGLKGSPVIRDLNKYMVSVVSGMLLSTCCSMIYESLEIVLG